VTLASAPAFVFDAARWSVQIYGTQASRRGDIWYVDGDIVPKRDIVREIEYYLDTISDEDRTVATTALLSPLEACLLCLGDKAYASFLSLIPPSSMDAPHVELLDIPFGWSNLTTSSTLDVGVEDILIRIVPDHRTCIAIADDTGRTLQPCVT